jgi:hypothetical protein
VRFEELVEQVAKLSKAGCLDAKSIMEVKTRIDSRLSTILPVREKVAEAVPPLPSPSPPTGSHRVRDPFPSPLPENNEAEEVKAPLLDAKSTMLHNTLKTIGQSWKFGRYDRIPIPLIAKLF